MHEWWPHLFSYPRFLDPINWFWLSTKGYAFTSSGLQLSIPVGIGIYLYHHNCHARGCWRLGKHPVEGTPYVACRKHHPHVPDTGATAGEIHVAHHEARVSREST